jgi:hypothetical protein
VQVRAWNLTAGVLLKVSYGCNSAARGQAPAPGVGSLSV